MGGLFSSEPGDLIDSALVLKASSEHKKTIIWLHGLGDSSEGFRALFRKHCTNPHVRVVLPNAPTLAVTINRGVRMPAWYDIVSMNPASYLRTEDRVNIVKHGDRLTKLLEQESALVGAQNVLVGGFSQGAGMALRSGLMYKEKLAGIMACSGYLLLSSDYPGCMSQCNKDTPIFAYHGTDDPMIRMEFAKLGYNILSNHGVEVEVSEEPGLGHSLSELEVKQMVDFWTSTLKLDEL